MPLAIEITLNILWIPVACLLSAIAGFVMRSAQLNKLRDHIHSLEKQNLQADAEILALEKANATILEQMKNNQVPVIPITTKENPETLPDSASRKKLLGKSTLKQ